LWVLLTRIRANLLGKVTMTVAILTVGSEILDGRVVNTNSSYLSQSLLGCGLIPDLILSCKDSVPSVVDALGFLSRRADVIVVTGGLGPTSDDLTRESVAEFCGADLEVRDDALDRLKRFYQDRGRRYDSSNQKQATFPVGAYAIGNPSGTAEGFSIRTFLHGREVLIVALPGVPRELRAMWEAEVLSLIVQSLGAQPPMYQEEFRVFGMAESVVGAAIDGLGLREDVVVSYRASFPEVHLVIRSRESLGEVTRAILGILGDRVVTRDLRQTLAAEVLRMLGEMDFTLAVAESCTGGGVGSMVTAVPGASRTFLGGVIAYHNRIKEQLLGVGQDTIKEEGAVSFACARQMAEGVRARFQSSVSISVSGIAGPDGGTPMKPVGTFFVGLSSPTGSTSYRFLLSSDRDRIRTFASYKALDVVRRFLLKLPPPDDAVREE
jgi:nicotinamide-nucleotide amidase